MILPLASELHLTSALADLAQVYPWLDEVATGVPAALVSRMHVVLEEAVANAALHGYPDGRTGHIVLRADRQPASLTLVVEDDGIPFDPTRVDRAPAQPGGHGRSLADVEPGGWGLGLIRAFAGSVVYRRVEGRNVLAMGFPLVSQTPV